MKLVLLSKPEVFGTIVAFAFWLEDRHHWIFSVRRTTGDFPGGIMKPVSNKSVSFALCSCLLFPLCALATSAPSNLAATASSSSQVSLTWTDNSSSETGYTFAYDTNSGWTSPDYDYAGGANTTSYSHTGRSPATTYYYKVKAEGNPDSAWSSVDSATTAPSGLTATATSESAIRLAWTGNSNNGAIIGYTYAFASNSSFTGATYKYVADNGSTSTSRTALATATTYWFKIKAEGTSDALDSPYGAVVTETTTPASFTATAVSGSQINLSWVGNAGNSRINGYTYAVSTNSSFTGATYTYVAGAGATNTSHTGLSPGTTYYYKIKVEGTSDSFDSAFTHYITVTTPTGSIPNAPSNLSASAVSDTRIDLSWTDNSTNETGFEVKRSTDSAFSQNVVWIGGIQGTTYASTSLNPGMTYYYLVRAQGTGGKSAYSNPASATTSGTPPPVPSGGIPISPHFAGINAWMPEKVGSKSYGGDLMAKWEEVEQSGVKIMRYGGSSVDCNADPSSAEVRAQYVSLVEAMKASGFEPVLQVAVCPRYKTYTAQKAGDLVRYINGTMGLGVKYWSIGNEPDLHGGNYSSEGYSSASQAAAYLMPFATEMKKADPTIKILAPETAWYNERIIRDLMTCNETADDSATDELINLPGKDENGNYYVDIISFHTYNGFDGTQKREHVITKLMAPGSFNADLGALKALIAECNRFNGRTENEELKIAVTEANVNHEQPINNDPCRVGSGSFLGGQFWAELMGIAMRQGVDFVTFWSVIEGGPSHPESENGYFSADGTKRPSYHHFQMMAENFRGSSIAAFDNDQPRVKVFAAQDVNHIAVLILNQEASLDFAYTVRLSNTAVSGTNPLKVRVDAGLAVEYSDTISSQSSTMLIFDGFGMFKEKIEYREDNRAPISPDC